MKNGDNMNRFKGFQSLLYYKFHITPKYDVKKVADDINISPSTLYKYISGELSFPPDLLQPLLKSTTDLDFLYFFTSGMDFVLLDKAKAVKMLKAIKELTSILNIVVESVNNQVNKTNER